MTQPRLDTQGQRMKDLRPIYRTLRPVQPYQHFGFPSKRSIANVSVVPRSQDFDGFMRGPGLCHFQEMLPYQWFSL